MGNQIIEKIYLNKIKYIIKYKIKYIIKYKIHFSGYF